MKQFYFLNQPAKYVNLNYIYFWDFKALPGDPTEKQPKGWAAGLEYMSQKSTEEGRAVLYSALFQIRDVSGKYVDLEGGTCSFELGFLCNFCV